MICRLAFEKETHLCGTAFYATLCCTTSKHRLSCDLQHICWNRNRNRNRNNHIKKGKKKKTKESQRMVHSLKHTNTQVKKKQPQWNTFFDVVQSPNVYPTIFPILQHRHTSRNHRRWMFYNLKKSIANLLKRPFWYDNNRLCGQLWFLLFFLFFCCLLRHRKKRRRTLWRVVVLLN